MNWEVKDFFNDWMGLGAWWELYFSIPSEQEENK
jgi:hypothetical protein